MCLYLRRGIIKQGKRIVAILLTAVMVVSLLSSPAAYAATLEEIFTKPGAGTEIDTGRATINDKKYKYYLEDPDFAGATNYTGNDIVLTPSQAQCNDLAEGSTKDDPVYVETPLTDENGRTNVLNWSEEYSGFTWKVKIPVTGFYSIKVEHLSVANDLGVAPTREFAINGKVPFAEAVNLEFKKWFKDADVPKVDVVGDESAPDQLEVREWATSELKDNEGYYMESFRFYFEAGINEITFNYTGAEMYMGNIIICAPEVIDDYATVSATYPQLDKNGADIIASFQAEYNEKHKELDDSVQGWLSLKSSNMLRPTVSKNTTVAPFKSGYNIINQVGGDTNWSGNRESLTWTFEVPADGLYKIALRVCNNLNIGMPVHRRIYIDGEVPFSELIAYRFRYDYNYYTETLSNDDGEAYLFYFTAGQHTIKLETSMGGLGDAALMFYTQTEELNLLIREINKILGDNPDPKYNYRLAERIPHLIPTLEKLVASFEELIEKLKVVCETDSSSLINELLVAIDTLNEAIDEPIEIPNNMGDITGIQTSLGNWITTLESSALMMDYIEIGQPNAEFEDEKVSVWAELKNVWDSFIVSFSKDYNAAYAELANQGKDIVEVWLSRDREYADMMMDLMNQEFTPDSDYDFSIKLRIVPGQIGFGGFNLLLLSLMSHQGPDLIWGTGAGDVVNYAIRGVGYDISQFEDYEEVASRFNPATMIGLSYSDNSPTTLDGVFGLPETSDVSMAFYRTDIFAELGIDPPDTWDEYFNEMLPAFYQENYHAMPSGSGVFLTQMNGWSWRANYRLSGFDTDLYLKAFQMDVDQYFIYGIDIANQGFQGFRDGDYPYMTGSIGTYTQLLVAAPELLGKWAVAPLPGIVDELGINNRATGGAGAGTCVSIMSERVNFDSDEEYQRRINSCWEIAKWWTSYDIQLEFTYMVDAKFGRENRWTSANMRALVDGMGWTPAERAVIDEMYNWYIATPVVLGSYQQDRYAGFAFNQVVIQGFSVRDSIDQMIEYINPELVRKQLQYDIVPATDEEIADKTYDVSALTQLKYYQKLREEALKNQNK